MKWLVGSTVAGAVIGGIASAAVFFLAPPLTPMIPYIIAAGAGAGAAVGSMIECCGCYRRYKRRKYWDQAHAFSHEAGGSRDPLEGAPLIAESQDRTSSAVPPPYRAGGSTGLVVESGVAGAPSLEALAAAAMASDDGENSWTFGGGGGATLLDGDLSKQSLDGGGRPVYPEVSVGQQLVSLNAPAM